MMFSFQLYRLHLPDAIVVEKVGRSQYRWELKTRPNVLPLTRPFSSFDAAFRARGEACRTLRAWLHSVNEHKSDRTHYHTCPNCKLELTCFDRCPVKLNVPKPFMRGADRTCNACLREDAPLDEAR